MLRVYISSRNNRLHLRTSKRNRNIQREGEPVRDVGTPRGPGVGVEVYSFDLFDKSERGGRV